VAQLDPPTKGLSESVCSAWWPFTETIFPEMALNQCAQQAAAGGNAASRAAKRAKATAKNICVVARPYTAPANMPKSMSTSWCKVKKTFFC